jgi:mannitol/fructose-specific phosphotransferase system IIA component (Ntr-type)
VKLKDLITTENIFIGNTYRNTTEFYTAFSKFLKQKKIIENAENIKRLFVKRESIQSTAIGKGAAAPHIFSADFNRFHTFVAYIKEGIDFLAPDKKKVYLIFLIMSDEEKVGMHLKTLSHIARLIDRTDIMNAIAGVEDAQQLHQLIMEKDKSIK